MPRGIFCIETVWFGNRDATSVRPMLQFLRDSFLCVPFIHRTALSEAEIVVNLGHWQSLPTNEFPILYLSYHGEDARIRVEGQDNSSISLGAIGQELTESCRYRIKGLSPWLRERMMLRAFPLLEGPDKARAAL